MSGAPVEEFAELREQVAIASRVLAHAGLVQGVLGHVSARAGVDRMLIRARGPDDRGLAFTKTDDVRLVDFDGKGDDLRSGYVMPKELPIHGETYRSRPDVRAVVHAHPRAVLLCGIAELSLRPVFGAFDVPAMRMAVRGVPIYPRSTLIQTAALAKDVLDVMGDRPICLLRGHGITAVGGDVGQAVLRALSLNTLASITLELARLGRPVGRIDEADVNELQDLESPASEAALWRYYQAIDRRVATSEPLSAGLGQQGPCS